ncbi:hypothetical protein RAS1_06520 [Phycisphaerae bacterium RAS1]|nr:hypothetical protein RAS1_06520 [Phycisphaerae bacterium RAS1]
MNRRYYKAAALIICGGFLMQFVGCLVSSLFQNLAGFALDQLLNRPAT